MATEYIARNPYTGTTFKGTAKSKEDFIILLVKKAPHIAGWYPDEIRQCIEEDLIKEISA